MVIMQDKKHILQDKLEKIEALLRHTATELQDLQRKRDEIYTDIEKASHISEMNTMSMMFPIVADTESLEKKRDTLAATIQTFITTKENLENQVRNIKQIIQTDEELVVKKEEIAKQKAELEQQILSQKEELIKNQEALKQIAPKKETLTQNKKRLKDEIVSKGKTLKTHSSELEAKLTKLQELTKKNNESALKLTELNLQVIQASEDYNNLNTQHNELLKEVLKASELAEQASEKAKQAKKEAEEAVEAAEKSNVNAGAMLDYGMDQHLSIALGQKAEKAQDKAERAEAHAKEAQINASSAANIADTAKQKAQSALKDLKSKEIEATVQLATSKELEQSLKVQEDEKLALEIQISEVKKQKEQIEQQGSQVKSQLKATKQEEDAISLKAQEASKIIEASQEQSQKTEEEERQLESQLEETKKSIGSFESLNLELLEQMLQNAKVNVADLESQATEQMGILDTAILGLAELCVAAINIISDSSKKIEEINSEVTSDNIKTEEALNKLDEEPSKTTSQNSISDYALMGLKLLVCASVAAVAISVVYNGLSYRTSLSNPIVSSLVSSFLEQSTPYLGKALGEKIGQSAFSYFVGSSPLMTLLSSASALAFPGGSLAITAGSMVLGSFGSSLTPMIGKAVGAKLFNSVTSTTIIEQAMNLRQ